MIWLFWETLESIYHQRTKDPTLNECFAQVKEIPVAPENPEQCPGLEENPEVAEMAEEVILKNPNNTSCIEEQKEDITLNGCIRTPNENPIPLTPEHPERFIADF